MRTGNNAELKFLGEYILPSAMNVKGTVVGGLSSIDYDAKRGLYYMVCDDPSAFSPARYYTAKINISNDRIDSVQIVDVTTILNKEGLAYPDIRKDRIHSADLEAMRYDPFRDELLRSSEGQRVIGKDTLLQDPDIVVMNLDGKFKTELELPAELRMQLSEKGPRHNSVLEGICFNEDYSKVFISLEDALYDDGPRAGNGDTTAWVRILKYDRVSGKQVAQFAYKIDAVPYPPNPAGAFKVNGISDILYIGNDQMLVVERAWSTGRVPSDVRIYLADLRDAKDISSVSSLQNSPPSHPVKKKLLLNLESLGTTIYNLEGLSFGPKLSNGHQSIIGVIDDNFSKTEKSQFLLFDYKN